MKNTFGNYLTLTLFGESHGPAIGAVLDGVAPGIPVREERIRARMQQRMPYGDIGTARRESDRVEFISGVWQGYTTGTPLCLVIRNGDTQSEHYRAVAETPRPSHADYTAYCKYHGFADPRGGGHFSGRLTAPLVAAGAILRDALADRGIRIGTHIRRLAGVEDRPFGGEPEGDIALLDEMLFPVLDGAAGEVMQARIAEAAKEGDSVGGILETAVCGMPAGVGEPFFDTLEGTLAHALFAIPGVKGVEFGAGFGIADLRGSEANDPFRAEGGRIVTATNRSGGIQGGITNGMPLLLRTAIKPTPSIYKEQQTVSLPDGEARTLRLTGRHDPAIVHRARAVADAVCALVLADALTGRYGTDWLAGGDGKERNL